MSAPIDSVLPPLPPPRSGPERLLRLLERRLRPAADLLLGSARLGRMALEELRQPAPPSWRQRLRVWRLGFTCYSWALGDLEREDPRACVNDVESTLAASINGPRRHLLNDKVLFACLMSRFPGSTARVHALVDGGRFLPGPAADCVGSLQELVSRLAGAGPAILKPAGSSHGHGVYRLEHDGTGFLVDGRRREDAAVARLLAVPGRQLVQEWVRQHDYAAAWFPETTNTLRIITMWDPQTDLPFVAAALQRIGTRASFPVDNTFKGGLWRFVTLPGGGLGPGMAFDRCCGKAVEVVAHPDTGVPLVGGEVPGLPAVLDQLLEIARALPLLPYVGWDVVITADGLRILEGNTAPELAGMGPLLRDARVRRFLGRHGILPPWRRGRPPDRRGDVPPRPAPLGEPPRAGTPVPS